MVSNSYSFFFFFNDTATTEIYTLSLHDALPISTGERFRSPSKNFVTDDRLDAEYTFEAADDRTDGRCPIPVSRFPFDRRHLDARNPARHDPLELGEVVRDVQSEPMPRYPLLHVDPDARDHP